MTTAAQITVNAFAFCAKHGDEFCQPCRVDHRLTNNAQVDNELSNLEDIFEIGLEVCVAFFFFFSSRYIALFEKKKKKKVLPCANMKGVHAKDRHPINVYAHGAVVSPAKEGSFECIMHGAVDCSRCFDWIKVIQKEAREASELGTWLERRQSQGEGLAVITKQE